MNAMHSAVPVAQAEAAQFDVSRWCLSRGKRLFDIALSAPMLACALPVMAVTALVVRITSPGPILFRQQRLGMQGKPFTLLKFRSMVTGSEKAGPGVTQKGDLRVSTCGGFLRKWKLDELPQLFNVLKGDMSIVGPRPDLPQYFAALSPGLRSVLQLRPGITGMASLKFRNEEDVLAGIPASELAHAYVTKLMPAKIELDMQYAKNASLLSDLGILLRTAKVVLS